MPSSSPSFVRAPVALAFAAVVTLASAPASALPPIIAFTSPTTIDEGREVVIEVAVTDPEGTTPTWTWDLDGDGTFGDLPDGTSHTIAATDTDGPAMLRVGVQASDGTETRTVYRTIRVNNVAPSIVSFPVTEAAVRREYRYEIAVEDPAGANDPIEYFLTSSPTGMTVEGNVISWTPSLDQRGRSFPIILRVGDGDGGDDDQSWTIDVARNTAPTAPAPLGPIEYEHVAEGEPITLVAQNGTDPDGDPLVYFFRLSRDAVFDPSRVIGSGEVAEQDGDTTSWTTPEPLEPGLWYWQLWAADGNAETAPRHAHFVVGTGALPDAGGPPDAGPRPDGGMIRHGTARGGCSVNGARASGDGLAWLALMALGAVWLIRRRRAASALAGAAVVIGLAACTSGEVVTQPPDDLTPRVGADADGDSIEDQDEGGLERVDTDGDGAPDYFDLDSDDDGVPDWIEAGDDDRRTLPLDSDGDGTPNVRDTDSDDNGIPDGYEVPGDLDLDGIENFMDLDDDDDLVRDALELGSILHPPADSDSDGEPNYHDPDSDDDTILDGDESGPDTDGDGLRDFEDRDSDNDGITDADEAGDPDLYSPPVDTDDDDIPDFRDTDSDNDGLSDANERELGTSPILADSDGDGVSDLIEFGAETDPLDGTVSPRTRGDFVFVVPFEEAPMPPRDTLRFRTTLQLVDVYFLFDISGSMAGEIGALRTAVTTIMGDLTCTNYGTSCRSDGDCAGGQACSLDGTCIEDPSLSSCVASPWTGGGIYETDLENLLSLQSDPSRTSAALGVTTFGGTENLYRAAWSVADPAGAPGTAAACSPGMPGFLGCPAFRQDAQRILVVFTDEDSDGTETAAQAGAALRYAGITTIGVWSGTAGAAARSALVSLATGSGSYSSTGAPLVFDGMDAGVVPAVTTAINEVVEGVPLRVTIQSADEPGDAGDALQFIDYLEVNTTNPACSPVALTEDVDDDGHDDAFPSLLPGTPVCWDVVARQNDTVEPTDRPLVFRARLTVYGDSSPVDSRIVYFLVPPVIPPPDLPI